jgi:phage baseplate assembly protein gpV
MAVRLGAHGRDAGEQEPALVPDEDRDAADGLLGAVQDGAFDAARAAQVQVDAFDGAVLFDAHARHDLHAERIAFLVAKARASSTTNRVGAGSQVTDGVAAIGVRRAALGVEREAEAAVVAREMQLCVRLRISVGTEHSSGDGASRHHEVLLEALGLGDVDLELERRAALIRLHSEGVGARTIAQHKAREQDRT